VVKKNLKEVLKQINIMDIVNFLILMAQLVLKALLLEELSRKGLIIDKSYTFVYKILFN